MTDHVLYIQWGSPIPTRESMSVELFLTTNQYFTTMKNQGEIDNYTLVGYTDGNLWNHLGSLMITGSATQIENLRKNEKFVELCSKGNSCMQKFTVMHGLTGEALNKRVQQTVTWRTELGIK